MLQNRFVAILAWQVALICGSERSPAPWGCCRSSVWCRAQETDPCVNLQSECSRFSEEFELLFVSAVSCHFVVVCLCCFINEKTTSMQFVFHCNSSSSLEFIELT